MDFQVLTNLIGAHNALIVFAAFGAASLLIAVLPAPSSTKSVYGYIWRIVNILAQNWGNGKSASHPDFQTIVKDLKQQNTSLQAQYSAVLYGRTESRNTASAAPSPSVKLT